MPNQGFPPGLPIPGQGLLPLPGQGMPPQGFPPGLPRQGFGPHSIPGPGILPGRGMAPMPGMSQAVSGQGEFLLLDVLNEFSSYLFPTV